TDGKMLNFGIGKRFELNEKLYFTAEGLVTQSLKSHGSNDYMVNVGLTYLFGKRTKQHVATPPPVAPVKPEKTVRLDSDKDGIYDDMDNCPNTPMIDAVDSSGCSRYAEEDESIRLSINFASNDDKVAQHYYGEIQRVADFMARYPDSTVVIEGHTSVKGGDAYNQQLSERRAKKVAGILMSRYSIAGHRVSHMGYGETRLVNTGNTNEAHSENRRIEARISGSKRVKVRR
ncbi:MAG: OOP family OmpA-OmpF porin, partial [Phenylobacterium sp.]